jgi:uracil-DNA glycosylase family 4
VKHPTRREKLVALEEHMNLETGAIKYDTFPYEDELFRRAMVKKRIDRKIKGCKLCPGLNVTACTESSPGFGNLLSPIMVVGQSLCTVCMNTQIPFTKGSGYLLDAALILSGLTRYDIFITNVLHCHPPRNRPSKPQELLNCKKFIIQEICLVNPKIVIAFGASAKSVLQEMKDDVFSDSMRLFPVKHPAYYLHKGWEEAKDWIVRLSLEMDKFL